MTDTQAGLFHRVRDEVDRLRFLGNEATGALMPYLRFLAVGAGEVLWREGDACDYVGFILSGRLEIQKATEFPGKPVIVGIYSTGAVVGELCIVDHQPREVTAVALEETCLAVLAREDFERLIEEQPRLAAQLLKGMLLKVSIRLRKSFERLAEVF